MSGKFGSFLSELLAADDYSDEFSYEEIKKGRFLAALSELPFLFWVPLAVHSTSRFVRFHANNGALMLAASGVLLVVSLLLELLPGGWLVSFLLWAVIAVASVFNSIDALSGGARELPLLCRLKIKLIK